MKLKLFFLSCFLLGKLAAQPYSASNFSLVAKIDPETLPNGGGHKYSGCWGWYQAAKNKEYAIAGSVNGTYWVDITVPSTPTVSSYKSGKQGCTWREIKTYQNYCYVISDDSGPNSFQIFDMQYLPDSVHKVYDSNLLFSRGHALWIDGSKLYIASVTENNFTYSSMNVYSLATPTNPTLIRRLDQDYPLINTVHDMFVRNDTVYASCAFQGLHVYNLQANNTFTLLGSFTGYPFSGYNHSSALTPDGQTLVFMDEVPSGLPVKIADVSNLGNIQLLATTNQFAQTTPHNPFMIDNRYCVVSSYQDGLQLYDISTPGTPLLAGYFDTHPQGGGNNGSYLSGNDYNGQWGAYPWYPSKVVFALDRKNGIFILNSHLLVQPVIASFVPSLTKACVGSTVNFVNTSTAASSYTWTYTGGSTSNATGTDLSLSFPIPGIYSVTLLASNLAYSTSTTKTISVVNNNLSGVMSLTYASCGTCSSAAVSINVSGGTAPFSYTWQPNGGNGSAASNLIPGCYAVHIIDAASCTYSAIACVEELTGLNRSQGNAPQPYIYPNPAKEKLTISFQGRTFNYRLYNTLGQLVSSEKNNVGNATIQAALFPKGVYFVEVETEQHTSNQKIIID